MEYLKVSIVPAMNGKVAVCETVKGTEEMYVWEDKKAPKFDTIIKQVRQQKKSDVSKELPELGDDTDEDDVVEEDEEGVEV